MRTALAALAALLATPAAAQAAYTGTVDAHERTATLTGNQPLLLSTEGGLVHHGDIGPGFASDTDFDSTSPGDQTVPDTGRWEIDASGRGRFEVREGETGRDTITFTYRRTSVPSSMPCVVRDQTDSSGVTSPDRQTRLCYHSGFRRVITRAGTNTTYFHLTDTESGVPLTIIGGAGDDQVIVTPNLPSAGRTPNDPAPAVTFRGRDGSDQLSLDESALRSTTPARYEIGLHGIRSAGLPALSFDSTVDLLSIYPQDGPATAIVRETGGVRFAFFGSWYHPHGPYRVDATRADAPVYAEGSSGDDTILGSAYSDAIDGGGGNDSIDSRDTTYDGVGCRSAAGNVGVDVFDSVVDCPNAHASQPFVGFLHAGFTPKEVKRGQRVTFYVVSTVAGKVTLDFGENVRKTIEVPLGPARPTFRLPRAVGQGRHLVSLQLTPEHGPRSTPVTRSLTVR